MSVSSTQFTRFLLIPAIQRIMRATPGSETVGEPATGGPVPSVAQLVDPALPVPRCKWWYVRCQLQGPGR